MGIFPIYMTVEFTDVTNKNSVMRQQCITELRGFIRRGGFTLVELMIIVAIVGIFAAIAVLSFSGLIANQRTNGIATELDVALIKGGMLGAVAYPAYQEQVAKRRRAGAQAVLMDIAQRQQQYRLDARNYASDLAILKLSPPNDVTAYYTISLVATVGPSPRFRATAAPKAGTAQENDLVLTINNAGVKTPANKW
jgi:type IV pilus assembly protein PilE